MTTVSEGFRALLATGPLGHVTIRVRVERVYGQGPWKRGIVYGAS